MKREIKYQGNNTDKIYNISTEQVDFHSMLLTIPALGVYKENIFELMKNEVGFEKQRPTKKETYWKIIRDCIFSIVPRKGQI